MTIPTETSGSDEGETESQVQRLMGIWRSLCLWGAGTKTQDCSAKDGDGLSFGPPDPEVTINGNWKNGGNDVSELTFKKLREVNWKRALAWHGNKSWSASDWMTAFVGEIGEAANIIKKLNRFRDNLPGNKDLVTIASLREDLAEELADCQIYLDLMAAYVNVDLEDEVRKKFNKTSERLGFEERL